MIEFIERQFSLRLSFSPFLLQFKAPETCEEKKKKKKREDAEDGEDRKKGDTQNERERGRKGKGIDEMIK